MSRPANVCLVVYVRPLGMVLLLLALGCNLIHEVLDGVNKFEYHQSTVHWDTRARHTHVALNVLNLNCRSSPFPSLQMIHLQLSTSFVTSCASNSPSSPLEGEMSFTSTILSQLNENDRFRRRADRKAVQFLVLICLPHLRCMLIG